MLINGQMKHNLSIVKKADTHHYGTRRDSHYCVDYLSTSMSENNALCRGLRKFNCLPSDIKAVMSVSIFKSRILHYLKVK